jgi:aryl carrier-like protein
MANGQPGRGQLAGGDAIREAAAEDRRDLLEGLLRDKVARVLGTAPERLDGDRPLLQLGLDSLMAVELGNWIEAELRVRLPIVELMRSPSLARLAERLARQFDVEETSAPHAPNDDGHANRPVKEESVLDAAPTELLARVGDLSAEQVDALLAALMSEATQAGRR